jgi:hypothetical protein
LADKPDAPGGAGHETKSSNLAVSALRMQAKAADWDFLIFLRDQGRKCAGDWLAKNFSKLGVESSVDIDKMYL